MGYKKCTGVTWNSLLCQERSIVPSMLNFTFPFHSPSYLQLPKVCFTNFDRGNQKLCGGVGSSANISIQTQIILTLQQQSSCSYFSALRQSVKNFMRVP